MVRRLLPGLRQQADLIRAQKPGGMHLSPASHKHALHGQNGIRIPFRKTAERLHVSLHHKNALRLALHPLSLRIVTDAQDHLFFPLLKGTKNLLRKVQCKSVQFTRSVIADVQPDQSKCLPGIIRQPV